VRGVRQFSRLVGETPPGRSVTATIEREGRKTDVQITPSESRDAGVLLDGDYLRGFRADLGRLGDHLPFDFNFDMSGGQSGRRLGVTVTELTDQLGQYFGAKEGVLVTSVTAGSAASRAGLTAGDVITSVNGQSIRSREDLTRSLRDVENAELTVAFVRDRKESTAKLRIP
jgi:S1-C subfamily serine protease